jgi:hypothetical protein
MPGQEGTQGGSAQVGVTGTVRVYTRGLYAVRCMPGSRPDEVLVFRRKGTGASVRAVEKARLPLGSPSGQMAPGQQNLSAHASVKTPATGDVMLSDARAEAHRRHRCLMRLYNVSPVQVALSINMTVQAACVPVQSCGSRRCGSRVSCLISHPPAQHCCSANEPEQSAHVEMNVLIT